MKYCNFIWTQEPLLKPSVFWPKFGSDEDWVSQLLIEYINDKSPVTQEEIDYALCWRKGPAVLFPKKAEKPKREIGRREIWDPLSCLPPPYVTRIRYITEGKIQDCQFIIPTSPSGGGMS